jgi:pre-mRNA-processing factor 17
VTFIGALCSAFANLTINNATPFPQHTKGVTRIRYLPGTGHLLLSASNDHTMKLWRAVGAQTKCLRTFNGHSKAVRDIQFTNDGKHFVSCSYDKFVKGW